MTERLIIVLGAGASADCASGRVHGVDARWRPPLVKDLFESRETFADVLNRYPVGQFAAADIRRLDPDSVSIEQFLRETYVDGASELVRRKFLSVPLYLQELLLAASLNYARQPDNYDLLITNAIDGTDMEVLFVTLNYDLLLDQRLDNLSRLNSLDDYIDAERGWSLVKLHGSVDWGRRVRTVAPDDHRDPPPYQESYPEIMLARSSLRGLGPSVEPLRRRSVDPFGEIDLYPALSVPLGERDELSCPDKHVAFLQQQLQLSDGIHLLVIGYSGIDLEVLGVIQRTSARIKTTMIVNRDEESAHGVFRRLDSQLARPLGDVSMWPATFNDFMQGDGWASYMNLVQGTK
jgi:hypothetical protein